MHEDETGNGENNEKNRANQSHPLMKITRDFE